VLVVGRGRESVGDDDRRSRCTPHVVVTREQLDLVRGDEQRSRGCDAPMLLPLFQLGPTRSRFLS
jgi:hypothetical protein